MKTSPAPRKSKIQILEILRTSTNYSALITTYRTRVLTQKTRTIRLLGRKSSAKILHTLLGYEVQASYKRIQCPDMPTARYLRLFSELGCHSIKLPYDPTLTEELIPWFEATAEGIKEEISGLFPGDIPTHQYVIRRVYEIIRHELAATPG
jgi:hypothetical protein